MKNLILILSLAISLSYACKHKYLLPTIYSSHSCYEDSTNKSLENVTIISPQDIVIEGFYGESSKYTNWVHLKGKFNPNNTNEIVYIAMPNNSRQGYLAIYEVCSGTNRRVTNTNIYDMCWGNNDWIIFKGYNQVLYKIKSTSDSLLQLTTSGIFNNSPIWINNHEFIYQHESNAGKSYKLKVNELTGKTDTLRGLNITSENWCYRNNAIWYEGYDPNHTARRGIYSYNIAENKHRLIVDFGIPKDNIQEVINVKANQLLVLTNRNLMFININTLHTDTIRKIRTNTIYREIDISADGERILATRWDNRAILPKGTIEKTAHLITMNIDGTCEKEILIPK